MYGKHFASMYTGSMYGAGSHVFAVWGYCISNANEDNTVELNPRMLADMLGDSAERIMAAIEFLTASDPNSRSKEEDGRRLLKVGSFEYLVVNRQSYIDIAGKADSREATRKRVARHRSKSCNANVTVCNGDVTPCNANVTVCNGDVTPCNASSDNVTQCNGDVTVCNGFLSTSTSISTSQESTGGEGSRGSPRGSPPDPDLRFTEDECVKIGRNAGVREEVCRAFFAHYAPVNFVDGAGREIKFLAHALKKWANQQEERKEKDGKWDHFKGGWIGGEPEGADNE